MNKVDDLGLKVDTSKNMVLQDAMFCSLEQVTNLNHNIGYLMAKRLLFFTSLIVDLFTDNQYIYIYIYIYIYNIYRVSQKLCHKILLVIPHP